MSDMMVSGLRLAFECDVVNVTALWDAAAARAANDFAMAPDDVVDTIGPREDPEIEACVSMLLDALVRSSGIFDAVTITTSTPVVQPPTAVSAIPRAVSPVPAPRVVDRSRWLGAAYAA